MIGTLRTRTSRADRRPRPEAATPRVEPLAGPVSILTLALGFGLLTGFLETTFLLARHAFVASTALGALQMNRNFAWMIPVVHVSAFLACALPIAILSLRWPVFARRAAIFVNLALAAFSLLLLVRGLYAVAAFVLAAGIARGLTPRVDRRAGRLARMVHRSLPVGLVILGGLGLHAYFTLVLVERNALAALPSTPKDAPNVLLIVLDTVRADRLTPYGYSRDTTPNLARLARRGVLFQQARSAAPWTFPSHASLFTGRWPHELNIGADRPLDATYPTIAEHLARNGYATAGFVGNTYFCNSWFGLGRGFAHYEDYYEQNIALSPGEALRCSALGRRLVELAGVAYNARIGTASTLKDARRLNEDFLNWQGAHAGRPFFAFLNYVDAHDPYLSPFGFPKHFGLKPENDADVDTIRNWHLSNKKNLSPRDLALASDGYDDCLAYLDEQLGQLFDALERKGLLDETLVVLTSDHGEDFGEHGLYLHGQSLYRTEVHVPLILAGPGKVPAGSSIASPASLRDVPATIVDRLALTGASPFPGRSLARFWEGKAGADVDDPILTEVAVKMSVSRNPDRPPAFRGPMASLIAGGKTYIRDAMGREELYDLAADPSEAHNLADEPAARADLLKLRAEFDRIGPPKSPAPLVKASP